MSGNNPLLAAEITAEFQGFKKGFDESVKIAQQGSAAISGSLSNIDRSFKVVNSTKFTFGQNFRTQAAMITPAVKNVAAGANQAGFALTNLGRVAQDLPFGFIGIQNNLNPLLESFQRLRAESGSNSAALKALGQSLIGPAGLGIALSVVTAAFTFYTMWAQKSKKETEDYIKSLDQLTQARLKGAQNAQKELTDLQTLYTIATNTTISLKQRKEAVDELQDKYPKYFQNLKDETILNGQAKTAYDSLTQSIIATARARAAQDLITQNASRQLLNEQKIVDLKKEQIKNEAELLRVRKLDASFNAETGTGGASPFAETAAQNAVKDTQKQINNLKTDSNILTQRNLELTKAIAKEVKNGADLTSGGGKDGGSRTIADVFKDLNKELEKIQADKSIDGLANRTKNVANAYREAKDALIDLGYSTQSEDVKRLSDLTLLYSGSLEAVNQKMKDQYGLTLKLKEIKPNLKGLSIGELSDEEKNRIKDNNAFLQSEFEGFGQGIGDALMSGLSPIEAFSQGVLGILGDLLTRFGKMTLAAGIAASALGKALRNPLNPANAKIAIAAGIALIAVGAAVKGFSANIGGGDSGGSSGGNSYTKNVPRFASGVNNFAGGLAMVGENGPEFVNLPTGADVIPNGRSMDLIGKNQNVNVVLGGEITADWRGLSIGLKRYNGLNDRTT